MPSASPFAAWLERVLTHGEAILSSAPSWQSDAAVRAVLSRAYADHALDVAGPTIPFDPQVAVAAARLLAAACWRLVSPDGAADGLPTLTEPRTPSAHLSGDVMLRFLPAVHRRAVIRSAEKLAESLADLLRRWPLSGVFADLPGPPVGELNFGGHPGLQLLYAERLAAHEKPAWVPADGLVRERVELVYHGRGRPVPRSAVLTESPDE